LQHSLSDYRRIFDTMPGIEYDVYLTTQTNQPNARSSSSESGFLPDEIRGRTQDFDSWVLPPDVDTTT
jgi:hypothetical protein